MNNFGDTARSLVATAGWARDRRDSFLYPTSGVYQRASLGVATPVLDLRYVRGRLPAPALVPVRRRTRLMLNGDVGYAHGYDGKELPFYKNFYAGGIGSVRGYQQSTLGPPTSTPTTTRARWAVTAGPWQRRVLTSRCRGRARTSPCAVAVRRCRLCVGR